GRVLITGYPHPLRYPASEQTCSGSEFASRFKQDDHRVDRIDDLDKLVAIKLHKFQSDLSEVHKWRFLDGHFKSYTDHSFCAPDGDIPNEIPNFNNGDWSFRPWHWKPYSSPA